ncbi:MAG: Sugar transporter permease [Chloroflexi bacterium]|jgi:multiple sugar transport system permease protein|nr:Sugar transporter permease [Chloroflexota bacterium]
MQVAKPTGPGLLKRPYNWIQEDSLAGMARRKALMGYIFLVPTMFGLMVFTVGPVFVSFALSLFSWNVIDPPEFIGVENYSRLLKDEVVITSFSNTAIFVFLTVSLQMTLALLLALAIQQKIARWLRYTYRTAFFIPLLTSSAAIAIVMAYMFNKDFGPINYYLGMVGIPRVSWLSSSQVVLITIVLTYVWQHLGFTLIVFTGGLGNMSKDVQEAADVDGASGLRRLWHITLPMLSPTILFAAVVGVISALQIFDQPYVLTRGGPGDSSRTVVMVIFEAAFKNLQIGYGSAIAVILFLVILLVTAFQFWLSKRWVFYQ